MTAHTKTEAPTCVRLKVRGQFLRARHGLTERRRTVMLQAVVRSADEGGNHIGIGFTATRKIGNAVRRNRAKRRMREAARQLLPVHGVAGCDYVFIARQLTAEAAWARLLDDMESALISLAATLRTEPPRA